MFTVNVTLMMAAQLAKRFQNISCLRLIFKQVKYVTSDKSFQNISCLRLIKEA